MRSVSRRLSIAFLSHLASPIAPTGAERSLVLLACELRRRGHRIAVVAPGPWALEESLRRADVPVTTIRSRASWITYYRPRAWPLALVKWIRGVWPQRAVSDIGRFLEQFWPRDPVSARPGPEGRAARPIRLMDTHAEPHARDPPAGALKSPRIGPIRS